MRKLLLAFSCLVVFANTSEAQINFTNVYSKQNALPRPVADASANDLLAITKTSELYAVGNFTKTFSFGGVDLEPIANSTYVIKYDATGNEQWGVSIQGAATPTSITTDNAGNLYVAGVFAEQILIGTTTGTAVSKTGATGTNEKVSSFIAKYSPDGVLLNSEILVPVALNFGALMTLDPQFVTIEQIKYINDKLYASVTTKGAEVTTNGIKLNGSFQNSEGWLANYLQCSHVVSLDDYLKVTNLLFSAGATTNLDKVSNASTPRFAVGTNGKLYVGFVGTGDINLAIGSTTKTLNFTYKTGEPIGYNGVTTEIDLNDMSSSTKSYETTNDNTENLFKLKDLAVYNNKLIICGTYNSTLAFDNSMTAIKKDDVFATALNLSDMSVAWAKSSGIDEGDATKNEEVLTSSIITGNKMILGINTRVGGEKINALTSSTMECDLATGTLSAIKNAPTDVFITGIASMNNYIGSCLSSKANNGTLTFNVSKNADAPTGINNTIANNEVKVYPTVATDNINFSEGCDVTVTSISGAIVAKASNVNSLSVASLSAGIYLVTVSNNNGTQTTKIVKR